VPINISLKLAYFYLIVINLIEKKLVRGGKCVQVISVYFTWFYICFWHFNWI